MKHHAICLAAFVSLISCAPTEKGSTAAGITPIPTYPHSPVIVSEFTGKLSYENGCLLFRNTRGQQFVPIWPNDSAFDGRRITVAIPGRPAKTLTVGREIRIGGSAQQWGNVPASPGLGDTASRCTATPYFVAEV
jgi:hypothetical protein